NALAGRKLFETSARGGTTVVRGEVSYDDVGNVVLVDTPGLGEVGGRAHAEVARDAARDADLVLLVVESALRREEMDVLRGLHRMKKRMVICLNKSDILSDASREEILEQIREQATGIVEPCDVLAVRAEPARRCRTVILADGTEHEKEVEIP